AALVTEQRQAEKDLRAAHDDLEQRVRERTNLLAQTNDTLRQEIAERQRAEEAMQRFAFLVESSDDAIVGKTLEGVIVAWNRGAERVYGYSAAEAVGRSIAMLVPPELPNELPAIMERIRLGESLSHYETVRVCKDGKRIDVWLTISPIRNSAGHLTGASVISRDITDQKRAGEKFEALLESAPDAMVIVQEQGHIVLVNVQAERLFGYSRQELLGQSVE